MLILLGGTLTTLAFIFAIRYGTPQVLGEHGWPNAFDYWVTGHLNYYANRWPALDSFIRLFDNENTLKGMPVVCLYWAAFFQKFRTEKEKLERRKAIAVSAVLPMIAVILARVLAVILPYRQRPLRVEDLHFHLPHGETIYTLAGWSSFPSDHAALFFALGIGLLLTSRFLGSIALIYTTLFILFPRIYLGLHWTTDILAGAVLGGAVASVALVQGYRNQMWRWVSAWSLRSPASLAAVAFILSYQFVDLFGGPMLMAKILGRMLRHTIH